MKSSFTSHRRIKSPKGLIPKISCSSGTNSNNPLLTNKGKVKKQDLELFIQLMPDSKLKLQANKSSPLCCKQIDESKQLLNSAHLNSLKFGFQFRSQDELASTNEESKRPCTPMRLLDKVVSMKIGSIRKDVTGYEISFKDADKFLQQPLKQSSKENCIVTVNDIN